MRQQCWGPRALGSMLGSVAHAAKPDGKVGLCLVRLNLVGATAPCLLGDCSCFYHWPEWLFLCYTPLPPVYVEAMMQLACFVHLVDAVEVGQQHRRLHHEEDKSKILSEN